MNQNDQQLPYDYINCPFCNRNHDCLNCSCVTKASCDHNCNVCNSNSNCSINGNCPYLIYDEVEYYDIINDYLSIIADS